MWRDGSAGQRTNNATQFNLFTAGWVKRLRVFEDVCVCVCWWNRQTPLLICEEEVMVS